MESVDLLDDKDLSFFDKSDIDLRNNGKVWADPKANNVGILRRDNKVYFDGIDSVNKESLGYIKKTINDYEI